MGIASHLLKYFYRHAILRSNLMQFDPARTEKDREMENKGV